MSKFHAVKDSDFVNDVCTLAKNTPKLVFPKHNNKRFMIREESTNENLYVVFKLNNGEQALIGRECHKPKQGGSEPAKTDLMCVYSRASDAIGYAYELKKTLGGKEVILGLLLQWIETVSYCKTQIPKNYYGFIAGVITEEFNRGLLDYNINKLNQRIKVLDNDNLTNSTVARKLLASSVNDRKILKRLEDFRDGKVEIEGSKLNYDIYYFESTDDKNELTLQFNGNIKPQVLRYSVS